MARAIASTAEFDKVLAGAQSEVIVCFWADWHPPSVQLAAVAREAAKDFPHSTFLTVNSEEVSDLVDRFPVVESVPTVLVLKNGKVAAHLVGANPPAFLELVKKHASTTAQQPLPQPDAKSKQEELNVRLGKLISSAPVMVFIKGTPTEPRCGFSRQILELLKEAKAEFGYFDILSDEEVRSGLKTYSNWPTYPQLYINGKLVGGLDIVKELHQEGELAKMLPSSGGDLTERLKALINQKKVMLFMKGTPDQPRCGFSGKMVALLDKHIAGAYGSFDILTDEKVRQGLKEYSNWPTFPQLYVDGKLVGGLDIATELEAGGELADLLTST